MRRQAKRNRELYLYYIKESEENGATYKDVGLKFGVDASRAFRIVRAEKKRLQEKVFPVRYIDGVRVDLREEKRRKEKVNNV